MNSFQYNLARFISFQDKAECERVRQIKKKILPTIPILISKFRSLKKETISTFNLLWISSLE